MSDIENFAVRVREASSRGAVIPCEGEEILELARARGFNDLALIHEEGRTYAYSEQHMTRAYAELAARAGSEDVLHAIAETVRSDSATYPRPTPVSAFCAKPFRFAPEQLETALLQLAAHPKYEDIQLVSASDGSRYLFSSNHLAAAHAASLAEWLSVGRFQNP